MIEIRDFIPEFYEHLSIPDNLLPWEITTQLPFFIHQMIENLNNEFIVENNIAIHKTAVVENGVILKAPIIIGAHCFIGTHAYLRGGVYLGNHSSIGPGCEVKTSIILSHTEIAHLNFIGDSIIGSRINFEAGSITANYYNERINKRMSVMHQGNVIDTGVEKFGSLVGNDCKIGANAVLSPGTILVPGTIIKRLELVEQIKE
jgi:bifunctional N-acetylglucosamine-1-phosphate-uridyltransferase/glucosamine-1-phosphate-acetyltransferase GlmU-like protein